MQQDTWVRDCLQQLFQVSGEPIALVEQLIRTNKYLLGLAVSNCACQKQSKVSEAPVTR